MNSVPYIVPIAAAPTAIVGYSEKRTCLILQNVGAFPVAISTSPDITAAGPIILEAVPGSSLNRIDFGSGHFGAIVRGPVYGFGSGGASSVGVIEGF